MHKRMSASQVFYNLILRAKNRRDDGRSLGKEAIIIIRRTSENEYEWENLFSVCFVPLIASAGWN